MRHQRLELLCLESGRPTPLGTGATPETDRGHPSFSFLFFDRLGRDRRELNSARQQLCIRSLSGRTNENIALADLRFSPCPRLVLFLHLSATLSLSRLIFGDEQGRIGQIDLHQHDADQALSCGKFRLGARLRPSVHLVLLSHQRGLQGLVSANPNLAHLDCPGFASSASSCTEIRDLQCRHHCSLGEDSVERCVPAF